MPHSGSKKNTEFLFHFPSWSLCGLLFKYWRSPLGRNLWLLRKLVLTTIHQFHSEVERCNRFLSTLDFFFFISKLSNILLLCDCCKGLICYTQCQRKFLIIICFQLKTQIPDSIMVYIAIWIISFRDHLWML